MNETNGDTQNVVVVLTSGKAATGRTRRTYVILLNVFVIFALVLTLVSYSLWQGRFGLQQEAAEEAENLGRVIERYVYTTIHESDLLLQVAQEEYRHAARHGDSPVDTYSDFLSTLQRLIPSVLNVRAADMNGLVKHGQNLNPAKPVSVADRIFFSLAKASPGLTISPPVLGRSSGEWVLPLARRLETTAGRVDGVVYAGVKIRALTSLFASLNTGQHSLVALFDSDTKIYLRHPERNGPGSSVGIRPQSPQFLEAWNRGLKSATFRASSNYDGIVRTYHYRQVGDYPLYVSVGLAEVEYMTPWRHQVWVSTGILVLLVALSMMLIRSLNTAWQAQRGAYDELALSQNRLQTSENHFRTLFQSPAIAQVLLDPSDLRIVDCNRALSDMLSYSHDELLEKRITDLDLALNPDPIQAIKQRLMSGEIVEFEAQLRRKDGELRDVMVSIVLLPSSEGHLFHATQFDISGRKSAETALRRALNESEDLYNNAATGYHSIAQDGRILRMNDTELRWLGYEREEVVGRKKLVDLLSPDSVEGYRESMQSFLVCGFVRDVERDMVRRDGSILPVLISATAVHDEQGQFVKSRSTVNDLTERRAWEKLQARLTRALRVLSDCNIALVQAKDKHTLLSQICQIAVNTGGYLMAWIGVAENDATKTVRPVAQSGYEAGYLESIRITWDGDVAFGLGPTGTAIRTGATQVNQNVLTNPKMIPWREAAIKRGYQSSIALPLLFEDQSIGALTLYAAEPEAFVPEEIQLLLELVSNLTYGILMLSADEQRKKALTALQASDDRLRLAKDAAGLGIFDHDMVSGAIAWDEQVRELLGLGADEPVSVETFYDGTHPEDRAAVQAAIKQAMNPAGTGRYVIEYRAIRRSDGVINHVSANGQVYFDAVRPIRMVGTIRNISARKRLEAAGNERLDAMELLVKNQVAAQTAAAIAHELNQPLVSVSAYSEAALRMWQGGLKNPEKMTRALQGAAAQAQRAGQKLHELIAFLHKGDAKSEAVDLNALITETVMLVANTGNRRFRRVMALESDLPPVLANTLQTQKVLLNLLHNALEAAPGVSASITVRSAVQDGMSMVTIEDNGPGLDKVMAERIFDPFFTSKPDGLGLGLTISRALIEAQGGQLWVDREGDRENGAIFHFTLPFIS